MGTKLHFYVQLQLRQYTPYIGKLLLVLLQACPLTQLLLVALVVTQVTHGAAVGRWAHAVGRAARVCRCGGVALEANEGVDKCVEVGLGLCGGEGVEARGACVGWV